MNFFEHQAKARTQTRNLIGLFFLSVVTLIAVTNLLIMVFLGMMQYGGNVTLADVLNHFDWHLFFIISLGIIGFIIIASLFKRIELSSGGKIIAEKLGGKLILANTTDFHEKQLLNVIAEMSIASGVAVPPVYLIDDEAINAFAAGFGINDAVIGVTKGAIKNLNREELQGVIAHEFSHIFNGDMRLSIKLIAILHGILVIGMMGYYILRSISHSRSSGKDGGGAIAFLGIGLMVIGYAGTFFGNLIKATVSRKRECLADASAVQFTRNPFGISSALKKIGGYAYGSKLSDPNAAQASHMFFANGVHSFLGSLMATHPPLKDRILIIDPSWNGEFTKVEESIIKNYPTKESNQKKMSIVSAVAAMVGSAGVINQESVNQARSIMDNISKNEIVENAYKNPVGARAIIYAIMVAENIDFVSAKLQIISNKSDLKTLELTKKLYDEISVMLHKSDKKLRLALIDLAMPSLKQMTSLEYDKFKENIKLLVDADLKVDFFEWSMMKILFNNLDAQFDKNSIEKDTKYKLNDVIDEASLFFSLMALTGSDDIYAAGENLRKATFDKDIVGISFFEKEKITIPKLDEALEKLNQLYPQDKQKLLETCAICIVQDGISFSEAELLRAFASALNCPMPLLESY